MRASSDDILISTPSFQHFKASTAKKHKSHCIQMQNHPLKLHPASLFDMHLPFRVSEEQTDVCFSRNLCVNSADRLQDAGDLQASRGFSPVLRLSWKPSNTRLRLDSCWIGDKSIHSSTGTARLFPCPSEFCLLLDNLPAVLANWTLLRIAVASGLDAEWVRSWGTWIECAPGDTLVSWRWITLRLEVGLIAKGTKRKLHSIQMLFNTTSLTNERSNALNCGKWFIEVVLLRGTEREIAG